MRLPTIGLVALVGVSTAALAQVGTDPIDNKTPAVQAAPTPSRPDPTPAANDADDGPAAAAPTSGDPVGASAPPPKSR